MEGIHETARKKQRNKQINKDGRREKMETAREREQENKSYMRLDFLQVPHIGYLILVASLCMGPSFAQSELQYKKCLG